MEMQELLTKGKRLLLPKEVAEILGVQVETLNHWRHRKSHELPYVKAGRVVRYKPADIQKFIDENTVVK